MTPVSRRKGPAVACWLMAICATASAADLSAPQLPTSTQPQIVIDGRGFIGTPIEAIAVSSRGDLVAAGADKVVRVWRKDDAGDGTRWVLMATLRGYQEPMGYETGKVHALRFSPDDRFLLVGVADNSLAGSTRVFDMNRPDRMHGIIPGHLACTRGIAFSGSGTRLATWSCDGQVIAYAWDAAAGSAREIFRSNYLNPMPIDPEEGGLTVDLPYCFGFLDEDHLVVRIKLAEYGYALVYSVRTGQQVSPTRSPAKLKAIAAKLRTLRMAGLRGKNTETCDAYFEFGADRPGAVAPWFAVGGMYREGDGPATYYAAAAWHDNPEVVSYARHALEPVAIACATQSDVVASTDMLGQIHLWKGRDGRRLTVLRPRARPIWSLNWIEPTRFAFGDSFFTQAEGYQFNHRGPLTHLLDLERMATATLPSAARPGRSPWAITSSVDRRLTMSVKKQDAYQSTSGKLAPAGTFPTISDGAATAVIDDSAGPTEAETGGGGDSLVPHNFQVPQSALGSVWSYAFVEYPELPRGAIHCLIGTQRGELYECALVGDVRTGYALRACKEYIGHSTAITAITVSPDRTKFATSSLDGTVRVWRLRAPRILADIPTTRDTKGSCLACGGKTGAAGFEAQTIFYSFDGQPFFERYRSILQQKYSPGDQVTIGTARLVMNDQQRFELKLAEVQQTLESSRDLAEPILSLYFANDGQWIAWTQEGFFTSSYSGAEHVGFHVNRDREQLADFFPAREFAAAFERPGLVLDTLLNMERATIPVPAFDVVTLASPPHRAARPIGPAPRGFVRPPEVRIVAPAQDAIFDSAAACPVEIEVVSHPEQPVQGVAVQLNDTSSRMVSQRTAITKTEDGRVRETYRTTIDLARGNSTLTAVAIHAAGQGRSDPVNVVVRRTGAAPDTAVRLFVLAIGISEYSQPDLRLNCARRDAEGFAAAMLRQRGVHFRDVEAQTLTDDQATAARIEDGLEWIRRECTGVGDIAVLLLSGHGMLDEDESWYFAPVDAQPNRIARTGISKGDFEKYLRPIRHLLVFADTSRMSTAAGSGTDLRMVNPFRGSGCAFFNACAMGNASRDEPGVGLGMFTKAILDCFASPQADTNRDGLLQAGEVRAFVERHVTQATKGRQIPVFEAPAITEDLVLGRPLGP